MVHDFLQTTAARLPDKVALVCDGERLTYRQVDAMADRLANALIAHGVTRGDRLVVHLENSVEAVVSIFAIFKAGAVCVPISPSTKPDKLAYILNDCDATALVTDVGTDVAGIGMGVRSLRFAVVVGDAVEAESSRAAYPESRRGPWCFTFADLQAEYTTTRPPERAIDLDLALLIYTSGSTGQPKGVMCDHGNIVFAARAITQYLHSREDDVVMAVLPLSFDYGLYQVFMTFSCGGTVVLGTSFTYPTEVLQQIEEERVTGLPGVPSMFAMLVRMDLSTFDLRSLRYVTNTAAALPPHHIAELRCKLPWVRLYSMYGLTETKRTLYLPPEQLDQRPGSVGIAIPGTEVWIEDAAGHRLGPGEVGELVVRGRHVMRGYWNAPEATAQRFRPGPLPGERVCHTGDLFRMDTDGFMYFVGRTDDIIKSRGHKVAPKEIENVLYEMHGVIEAGVVAVPDPILGQAIKAVVVCDEHPLTRAEVLAHCRARLEDYMVPKYVEFRDQLPKTASGKTNRKALGLSVSSQSDSDDADVRDHRRHCRV